MRGRRPLEIWGLAGPVAECTDEFRASSSLTIAFPHLSASSWWISPCSTRDFNITAQYPATTIPVALIPLLPSPPQMTSPSMRLLNRLATPSLRFTPRFGASYTFARQASTMAPQVRDVLPPSPTTGDPPCLTPSHSSRTRRFSSRMSATSMASGCPPSLARPLRSTVRSSTDSHPAAR